MHVNNFDLKSHKNMFLEVQIIFIFVCNRKVHPRFLGKGLILIELTQKRGGVGNFVDQKKYIGLHFPLLRYFSKKELYCPGATTRR